MIYTVAEFRKNTRKILDAADRGEPVTITRFDQEYELTPKDRPNIIVSSNPKIPTGKISKKDLAPLLCPHGNLKGECLDKKRNRKCEL